MRMKDRIETARRLHAKYPHAYTLAQALRDSRPAAITYNPASTELYYTGERWIENASKGLRVVGLAYEVARANYRPRLIKHTGWYIDEYQDETVSGAVLQLPARKGMPQYLAALADPFNDDAYNVDFSETFDDPCEAAMRADGMSERYAELEREFQREESAKQRIEDISEELTANRKETLDILAERKALLRHSAGIAKYRSLCAAIVSRVESLLETRSELFSERETLRESL